MPQAPDACHRDLVRGLNIELNQWIKHGNSTTKQWSCGGFVAASS